METADDAKRVDLVRVSPSDTAARPAHRPEIDGLRALAVLGVVYFHASEPTASHMRHLQIEALGSRGVDLFFVLSGLCLSLPLSTRRMRTSGDVLTFVRRRFTRIAPTFYVALGIFALLAATPFGLPSVTGSISWADQRADLLRDALFFQAIVPIHDPPMWTLGIEMRWYLVFPFLLMLFYRTKILFVLAMLVSYMLYQHPGIYDCGFLPTFMLGIIAAQLLKVETKAHGIWPFVAAVAVGLVVRDELRASVVYPTDFPWAFAMFAFVLAVTTNPVLRRFFSWRPLVGIGVASYSIYLVHMPFLDSLVWAGVPKYVAGLMGVAIGVAFWYAVERPLCSTRVRRVIDTSLVRAYHLVVSAHASVAVSESVVASTD